MSTRLPLSTMVILLLLAGCRSDAVQSEDNAGAAQATVTASAVAVVTPPPSAGAELPSATVALTRPLVLDFPTATTVAEAGRRREGDWARGAEVPVVTIVEYGDFQ